MSVPNGTEFRASFVGFLRQPKGECAWSTVSVPCGSHSRSDAEDIKAITEVEERRDDTTGFSGRKGPHPRGMPAARS